MHGHTCDFFFPIKFNLAQQISKCHFTSFCCLWEQPESAGIEGRKMARSVVIVAGVNVVSVPANLFYRLTHSTPPFSPTDGITSWYFVHDKTGSSLFASPRFTSLSFAFYLFFFIAATEFLFLQIRECLYIKMNVSLNFRLLCLRTLFFHLKKARW